MGSFRQHNFGFQINPPLPHDTQVGVIMSPDRLQLLGLNMPVEISTASADRQPPTPLALNSIVTMAHFDTGASITSIDVNLARHLNLIATGESISHTAAGAHRIPTFAVDLSFPNTDLSPFSNLQIGSCRLYFNIRNCQENPNDPQNFGLLIGRDIMSKWNIVWNGPSSTIFIND